MKYIWVICLLLSLNSHSQSLFTKFREISSPERWWVVFHPFKAKKAYLISKETLKITDSIRKSDVIGKDINGGKLDAFKHGFWLAYLTREIGKRPSLKLGKAHERGNYRAFKKNKTEDGTVPDKASSDMDLFNNEIGAKIALKYPGSTLKILQKRIVKAIGEGQMRILKKDSSGNFLTCDGKIIPKGSLNGTWKNDKCMIPSND